MEDLEVRVAQEMVETTRDQRAAPVAMVDLVVREVLVAMILAPATNLVREVTTVVTTEAIMEATTTTVAVTQAMDLAQAAPASPTTCPPARPQPSA
jgi:hypothetical protein